MKALGVNHEHRQLRAIACLLLLPGTRALAMQSSRTWLAEGPVGCRVKAGRRGRSQLRLRAAEGLQQGLGLCLAAPPAESLAVVAVRWRLDQPNSSLNNVERYIVGRCTRAPSLICELGLLRLRCGERAWLQW